VGGNSAACVLYNHACINCFHTSIVSRGPRDSKLGRKGFTEKGRPPVIPLPYFPDRAMSHWSTASKLVSSLALTP